MADVRGGAREGAGRKSKAEEQKLVEKLSPIEPKALEVFKKAIQEEKQWAVKMFFEYMYGKPTDNKNIDVKGSFNGIIDMSEWK
jgi:hypothetical protein